MSKIIDFYKFIDSIAPFETQESWDNSGFLVGNGEKEAKKVLLALDVTEPVLSEAAEIGAELIISHHPVIFGALKEFHPKNIAFLAAEKGIAIISAHTCLDIADGGVNDCLAAALGLEKVEKVDDGEGLIRMGELPEELSCSDFVKYVADKINVGGIKYTPTDKMIKKVAVCGGSGGDLYPFAISAGADAFVTANIKHNIFIDIRRDNFCVLDAGHFCTENTVIEPLAEKLRKAFPDSEIIVSEVSEDPACYWAK
ncbi:MAG: Nif3-like dinuclear metal center hexameric protein [Oscillospiraceae bacterium]|nr:Nif3-like dinuclear metal center hexameric protein [Oscillospiraceae bacterium]